MTALREAVCLFEVRFAVYVPTDVGACASQAEMTVAREVRQQIEATEGWRLVGAVEATEQDVEHGSPRDTDPTDERIAAAVAAERERCARAVDSFVAEGERRAAMRLADGDWMAANDNNRAVEMLRSVAAAIREGA